MRSGVDDTALLTLLKDIGFTAGEVGFYLTRSVDETRWRRSWPNARITVP